MAEPWELTFEADAFALETRGVPCPIDWCEAHVLRYAPCGDTDGAFYGGVHVGRVNRAKDGRWARRPAKAIERLTGEPATAEGVAILISIEDGLNTRLLSGPPTKAQREQARARGLMK
jgi:hypothetical protein